MTTNLYAPPTANLADVEGGEDAPPLWNPNAAANWSLIFTPAFGAYLHMKNWQALGETEKATSARSWMIASLAVSLGLPLLALFVSAGGGRGTNILGFGLLLAWYFSSAKTQMAFVKTHFGQSYPRRGWATPLLLGVGALISYFVFWAVMVAVLLRS